MSNKSEKAFVIGIVAFVFVACGLYSWTKRLPSKDEASEAAETAATEASTEAATEEPVDENGFTEAEKQEYIEASHATFGDDVEKDISITDDKGEKELKIGNYYVDYNGSYATSGTIMISDYRIPMVMYNDGDEDDIKGFFLAYPIMENVEKPTTIDQCKSILSEYIPAGTGYSSVWEETDAFFIRLLSGYSTDDSAGIMSYTFVPKRIEEGNIYQIILSASKSGDTITPISEESFNSAVGAIKEAVNDSEIFLTDYDEVKDALINIAYFETSTSDSVGSIAELAQAHLNYLQQVYGTTDLSTLTDEEIDELYWKYTDPRGYAEYQYYENGIGELDENGNVVVD